jgi:hypothetical protein
MSSKYLYVTLVDCILLTLLKVRNPSLKAHSEAKRHRSSELLPATPEINYSCYYGSARPSNRWRFVHARPQSSCGMRNPCPVQADADTLRLERENSSLLDEQVVAGRTILHFLTRDYSTGCARNYACTFGT